MKEGMKYLAALAICLVHLLGYSQYKLNASNSSMTIDGTSTIHDWTEVVEEFTGTLNATVENNKITKINASNIKVKVESIKSGKSGMDDNTYKALDSKKHPEILYSLKSYKVEGNNIHLTGKLTIAGVTKEVKFKVSYSVVKGEIKINGSHKFNMTDFGIDPPTAVMGTIKTGNQIEVKFNLAYKN